MATPHSGKPGPVLLVYSPRGSISTIFNRLFRFLEAALAVQVYLERRDARVPGTRGLRRVQGVPARPVGVRLHLRHCRAGVLPPGFSARPRPGLASCMHHQFVHHPYESKRPCILGRLHGPDHVSVALLFFLTVVLPNLVKY
jgi:hypothetical protein